MEFIINPYEIEKKSFEIITQTLANRHIEEKHCNVLKRVIHTTADFDYADNLVFSNDAIDRGKLALKSGAYIVTDTKMVKSGINKNALDKVKVEVECFIDSIEVAKRAKEQGVTRSGIAVEYALENIKEPIIFAVGNAPTALIKLYELIKSGVAKPELVIGVPVGFVNVEESKELIMSLNVPYIVAKGRKGGSNVAVAICNALLYEVAGRD